MHEEELRYRQIHLDYHTSECIDGVGANFDPDEFAHTLKKAAVDSITVFGRCHHGWLYYDSKVFPERLHPHLANKNLLPDQIKACHKAGIRAPIYLTIQWDNYTFQNHPDWMTMEPSGKLTGTELYQPGFYNPLCVNSPFRQFMQDHIAEVYDMMPVDGLFLDIVQVIDCSCHYCQEGMKKGGFDASDTNQRWAYAKDMLDGWKRETSKFIRSFDKDATIFYNAGHVGPHCREIAPAYSHWELESLPAGGWGYLHFPATQRYARNLGIDTMGMTGKFHTSWGDFHSYKNQPALEFECLQMVALNAKCSIGDLLPPDGKICKHTYDLIGSVYRTVEQMEPWCRKAEAVVDIGVFCAEEFIEQRNFTVPMPMMGLVRMLQEGGHQFDVIDSKSPLAKYNVLILPDTITVDAALAAKLAKYVAGGGKLLASYKSGLNEAGDAFFKSLGVEFVDDAPFSPDFIVPKGGVGKGLPAVEHVMYRKGLLVKVAKGAKTLSSTKVPYFNRTWDHYCSHRHTPSSGKKGYPAIVENGNCIYFAHPVFEEYAEYATLWTKTLVLNALAMLLDAPTLTHDGPSTLVTAVNRQKAENRLVVHLLHYIPERRADFDIIEDVIPLHDLGMSVKAPKKVKSVRCQPSGQELDFEIVDGRAVFTLPKLVGHELIELGM